MGAHCAKLCALELPDPRRRKRMYTQREVDLGSILDECCSVRVQPLRDSGASVIFKEGFTLGLRVRKLQNILEALDAADVRGAQDSVPVVQRQDTKRANLASDETIPAVVRKPDVAVKIKDDHPKLVRKREPHSFRDLIKDDFKPWLRVSHHPGSPASLP